MRLSRFSVAVTAIAALALAGFAAVSAQTASRADQAVLVQSGDAPMVRAMRFLGSGGRIGVTVKDLESAEPKPAGAATGAVVDDVVEDGPAAKAGVRSGDVITTFDGERVRSARQLSRLVEETPVGRTVTMSLLRGGTSMDVSVAPEASNVRFMVGPDDLAIAGEHVGSVASDEIRKELDKAREKLEQAGEELKQRRFQWRVAPEFDFEGGGPNVFSWTMRGPRLGVGIQDLTPELAEYFGVKQGVLVTSVTAESPAAKAGVKAGDVITSVGGTTVEDSSALRREIWKDVDAKELTLSVVRDKKSMSVKVAVEPAAGSRGPTRVIQT